MPRLHAIHFGGQPLRFVEDHCLDLRVNCSGRFSTLDGRRIPGRRSTRFFAILLLEMRALGSVIVSPIRNHSGRPVLTPGSRYPWDREGNRGEIARISLQRTPIQRVS